MGHTDKKEPASSTSPPTQPPTPSREPSPLGAQIRERLLDKLHSPPAYNKGHCGRVTVHDARLSSPIPSPPPPSTDKGHCGRASTHDARLHLPSPSPPTPWTSLGNNWESQKSAPLFEGPNRHVQEPKEQLGSQQVASPCPARLATSRTLVIPCLPVEQPEYRPPQRWLTIPALPVSAEGPSDTVPACSLQQSLTFPPLPVADSGSSTSAPACEVQNRARVEDGSSVEGAEHHCTLYVQTQPAGKTQKFMPVTSVQPESPASQPMQAPAFSPKPPRELTHQERVSSQMSGFQQAPSWIEPTKQLRVMEQGEDFYRNSSQMSGFQTPSQSKPTKQQAVKPADGRQPRYPRHATTQEGLAWVQSQSLAAHQHITEPAGVVAIGDFSSTKLQANSNPVGRCQNLPHISAEQRPIEWTSSRAPHCPPAGSVQSRKWRSDAALHGAQTVMGGYGFAVEGARPTGHRSASKVQEASPWVEQDSGEVAVTLGRDSVIDKRLDDLIQRGRMEPGQLDNEVMWQLYSMRECDAMLALDELAAAPTKVCLVT